MLNLLSKFSLTEVIICLTLAAIAVKNIVEFYDWVVKRLKKGFDEGYISDKKEDAIYEKFEEEDKRIEDLEKNQAKMLTALDSLNTKVDLLIVSDMDDIKSFITKEHHRFCYEEHWIDDYSLDCCERRYKLYRQEEGKNNEDNPSINRFMDELRGLPNTPPH